MNLTHRTSVRVRYAETDQMGVVYHSNYIVWFEVGRAEFLRSFGLAYTNFEKEGLGVVVVEVNCRYRRPANYDDLLWIETSLVDISPRKLTFNYKVLREDTLLAEGQTVHVFVDRNGKSTDARSFPIWTKLEEQFGDIIEKD